LIALLLWPYRNVIVILLKRSLFTDQPVCLPTAKSDSPILPPLRAARSQNPRQFVSGGYTFLHSKLGLPVIPSVARSLQLCAELIALST